MQTSLGYCFYFDDEPLLFKQTYLRRSPTLWGNSSTTSSFFVFRCLSIFWITNGCSLDTSLCLNLRTANAVQIGFPADLSMLTITLTATPHCSQVSMSMLKTRLSLCAQVIDWCFCARFFPALSAMFV